MTEMSKINNKINNSKEDLIESATRITANYSQILQMGSLYFKDIVFYKIIHLFLISYKIFDSMLIFRKSRS